MNPVPTTGVRTSERIRLRDRALTGRRARVWANASLTIASMQKQPRGKPIPYEGALRPRVALCDKQARMRPLRDLRLGRSPGALVRWAEASAPAWQSNRQRHAGGDERSSSNSTAARYWHPGQRQQEALSLARRPAIRAEQGPRSRRRDARPTTKAGPQLRERLKQRGPDRAPNPNLVLAQRSRVPGVWPLFSPLACE
jgi:hypothetical protein